MLRQQRRQLLCQTNIRKVGSIKSIVVLLRYHSYCRNIAINVTRFPFLDHILIKKRQRQNIHTVLCYTLFCLTLRCIWNLSMIITPRLQFVFNIIVFQVLHLKPLTLIRQLEVRFNFLLFDLALDNIRFKFAQNNINTIADLNDFTDFPRANVCTTFYESYSIRVVV